MENVYSTFQIAKICRVTPRTVANWIDDNLLKSFKTPGKYRKVLDSDLKAFLDQNGMPHDGLQEVSVKRVLVLDNEPETGIIIKKHYQTKNSAIRVETEKHLQKGLLKIAFFRPDVIYFDAQFKGMDTQDFVKSINAWIKEKFKIEIVPLVKKGDAKSKEKFNKLGLSKIVEKPIEGKVSFGV